jgi:hypothetical protein
MSLTDLWIMWGVSMLVLNLMVKGILNVLYEIRDLLEKRED